MFESEVKNQEPISEKAKRIEDIANVQSNHTSDR